MEVVSISNKNRKRNKKRNTMLKDLNRKETGDVLDSFTEMERLQATLNQMTPEMFPMLLKQMEEMTIDTEEKMKGVVNLVFEKAISEPNCSFIYANMCHCLNKLKVSTCDTPGVTVSFRKILLDLCQKEFNTDIYNEEIFKKREMELDAATEEEVRTRLIKELDEAKDAARRRTLGNIKFIGELFKAKKLHEIIIHDCVVKQLKNHDEESLECLCILLSTVGKDLDFEKSRKEQHSIFQMPFFVQSRMDEYFNLMKEIIEDRLTSSRICFKLQDLIDLRQNNWIPRRGDQIPKTIKQIHEVAELEEQREQMERLQATLNQMTPEMFPTLLKQMEEMTIDTEEKMKGVVNLVFEKAISEPNCSFIYANMCHCLNKLEVSTCDTPGVTVSFQKLLLELCQKEFNTDRYNEEIFKKREMELDAATEEEVRTRLIKELDEAKDAARRRTLGNIKFIGELFKAKKLHEIIIHDCVVKQLKNHDEESLECLCILLSTVGKDLDFEKSRPRMDVYFNLMKQIIEDRQTSSRICFKLQDLIDLRQNNWIPRRGDQIPKTIKQIHEVAELEEQREQINTAVELKERKKERRK